MSGVIYFAFNHFDTGGLQTLMVRMAEWSDQNELKAIIVYKTCDVRMIELASNKKIELICAKSERDVFSLIKDGIHQYNNCFIISFEIDDFLQIENSIYRLRKKNDIKHFLYTVSIGGTIFSKKLPFFIQKRYGFVVKQLLDNLQLLFMDEDVWKATSDFYGLESNNVWDNIFLIPMNINSYLQELKHIGDKQILTVTRAAFPYKGYVISLIDDFLELFQRHDDITLKIVSVGQDLDALEEKINLSNVKCQNRITLVKGLSLEEINAELAQTYIYVGMGTTVLDAANLGVPCVVSVHSTMNNECVGYFHNEPRVLGEIAPGVSAESYIEDLLLLTQDDYELMRRQTYEGIRNFYDINPMMERLLSRSEKIQNIKICRSNLIMNEILHKIRIIKQLW